MTTQTTPDKTYNGWTNYETWNVKLWIDNEQGSVNYWQDRALNWLTISKSDDLFTKQENAINDLRNELKEYFEENNPLPEAGMYTDLLNAALSEVNWHEIAQSMIEEIESESK